MMPLPEAATLTASRAPSQASRDSAGRSGDYRTLSVAGVCKDGTEYKPVERRFVDFSKPQPILRHPPVAAGGAGVIGPCRRDQGGAVV